MAKHLDAAVASVTTSTSGCCFSNAAATSSNGTIRLPAYMSFTCRLSARSRPADGETEEDGERGRGPGQAAPRPVGRRSDHLTAASSHFTRTTMRAIPPGI